MFVTDDEVQAGRADRAREVLEEEQRLSSYLEQVLVYNESIKSVTKNRINHLLDLNSANTEDFKQIWQKREKYRTFLETKNASLKLLLEVGDSALEALLHEEETQGGLVGGAAGGVGNGVGKDKNKGTKAGNNATAVSHKNNPGGASSKDNKAKKK